ncbi:MAG: hypothetical protein PHQ43_01560 [Dehalococcoidales bacterium]|nr:hypothetical protein [Dehalococcoidales bacterium]
MAIKKSLGKFGSRFAFEFFLETMHDSIIQGLKKYLSSINAGDIPTMVRKGQFPPLAHLDFSVIGDNIEHIEKISLVRLVEFIAEARSDLAAAIQDMGPAGAEYMVKLRTHILDKIRQSAVAKEFKPEKDMVFAHCDECGKKWPVPRQAASSITKCPFCGAGEKEEKEPPVEEE